MVWSVEEKAALVGIHDEAVAMGFDTSEKQGLDKMLEIAHSRGLMLRYKANINPCHGRKAVRKKYLELTTRGSAKQKPRKEWQYKETPPSAPREREELTQSAYIL